MTAARRTTASTLAQAFGLALSAAWGCALLAFPVVKGLSSGYVPLTVGLALGAVALRYAPRIRAAVSRLPASTFLVVLLGAATLLRVAAVLYFPLDPKVDDEQFHRYAVSMVTGGAYGAPGYRAWFPPGMSLLLTGWYWLTTPTPLAGKLLQVIASAVLVWQVWAAARAFVSESAARIAAIITGLSPTLVFYTATLGYEIVLGLILIVICRLVARIARAARVDWRAAIGCGLLLGAGALIKPICLPLPALFGAQWWLHGMPFRRSLAAAVVVLVAMSAVVAPWTYRNYRVLGAFVPVSTNGGTTFYAANNPDANGLAMVTAPLPGETDEVSRDRLRMRAGWRWIADHPARAAELAAIKVSYMWGTSSSIMSVVSTDRLPLPLENVWKAALLASWAAFFVWVVAGTWRTSVWREDAFVPMALVIAFVFAIHLLYEAHSRHHIPLMPMLAMVAAAGLANERERRPGRIGPPV